MTKHLYIGWAYYGRMASSLARKVKSSRNKFDLVIGIARGGVPLALVISDALGVKVDIVNVKSYTGINKREKPRILSTLTSDIKGKSILVVDDLIEHGSTMNTVLGHFRRKSPIRIMTAVLFKKPWSKFHPDFYLKSINKWVVFPWERGEVSRLKKTKPF